MSKKRLSERDICTKFISPAIEGSGWNKQTKPEEVPFEIPKDWVWCRLREIALEVTYGTSEKSFADGEIPVLRMGNITAERFFTVSHFLPYVKRIRLL